MSNPNKPLKCVVVGDGFVGKTCLLTVVTQNRFPEDYVPTIFDTAMFEITLNNQRVVLELWDTAGQEDYDNLRIMSYSMTDVIVLCYSVAAPSSYENIKHTWIRELRKHCPVAPIILVGTKVDLRGNAVTDDFVSKADGEKLAETINAAQFLECSARQGRCVREVFEDAARAVLQPNTIRRRSHGSRKWCLCI